MGAALATAVLKQGDVPIVVSGLTAFRYATGSNTGGSNTEGGYPAGTQVRWVETTEQMLECCLELFPQCAGVIGAAAPCDFKPAVFSEQKISKPKDVSEISLSLAKTPDILAVLGMIKQADQWSVSFALETEYGERKAIEKMRQKRCDFVVLNDPSAIGNAEAVFHVFDSAGTKRISFTGTKTAFAEELLQMIHDFRDFNS